MSELIQTGFDYAALPVDVALKAQLAANSIKLRLKRTVEDIIEIGRELTAVKDELPHGQFLPWIEAEFEMTQSIAYNFMQVNERFGSDKLMNFISFKPSVLYALAAPSTPEAVIDKAIAKAESGEKVTVADVKDWKAELETERKAREEAERMTDALRFRWEKTEESLLEHQQRNRDWQEQSNQQRKHIEALERRIDAVDSEAKPEPVKIEVPPADYASIKAKAAKAEQELAKLKKEQAKLVNEQVKTKLQGYQDEVNEMEKKKKSIEDIVARKQAYLDSLSSEVKRIETHREVINGTRLELIGLAGFLSDLEPMTDADTVKRWQALAGMLDDASRSIRMVFEPVQSEWMAPT